MLLLITFIIITDSWLVQRMGDSLHAHPCRPGQQNQLPEVLPMGGPQDLWDAVGFGGGGWLVPGPRD